MNSPDYQVLSRKFRPQKFCDVIGQEAIVTTLKNAIGGNRLSHAYLFSGAKGTGKTTLARLLAKAINCDHLDDSLEPCSCCSSCKEIASGHSLDVLEIDGASHRGIEDIRQINETVGYTTSSGKYKVYIIDEVHMLTKEAFNALLKTLEEPPAKVKFFFATTEPHKIPPTILSRCQIFHLRRISPSLITHKLKTIAASLQIDIEEKALLLLAKRAEGGLRDAESLFDQVIAFHEGNNSIAEADVLAILGMLQKDVFFSLDKAILEGNLSYAFDLSEKVFSQGKDLPYFVEALLEHFRNLLLVKLTGKEALTNDKEEYFASSSMYTIPQLLSLIDELVQKTTSIRGAPNQQIALEALLLKILRSSTQIPIETILEKLTLLQRAIDTPLPKEVEVDKPLPPPEKTALQLTEELPSQKKEPTLPEKATPPTKISIPEKSAIFINSSQDLDERGKTRSKRSGLNEEGMAKAMSGVEDRSGVAAAGQIPDKFIKVAEKARLDTLLQFAAVELEGTLKRN